jgi:hypothetical protein
MAMGKRRQAKQPTMCVAGQDLDGYHSNQSLVDLEAVGVRTYISEPDWGRRNWRKKPEARGAVYRSRRRIRGTRGLRGAIRTP